MASRQGWLLCTVAVTKPRTNKFKKSLCIWQLAGVGYNSLNVSPMYCHMNIVSANYLNSICPKLSDPYKRLITVTMTVITGSTHCTTKWHCNLHAVIYSATFYLMLQHLCYHYLSFVTMWVSSITCLLIKLLQSLFCCRFAIIKVPYGVFDS